LLRTAALWHSARMTTATTRHGAVRGAAINGVTRFLGIPYAASPTGPLRFAAPEPPAAWDGTRDCTRFGATPPKPAYVAPFDTLLPEPDIPGDDWLTLNIWTPDQPSQGATPGTPAVSGRAPVMVWIHGGAFSNGNSAVAMYDGYPFARDGVVLVSINYRLGIDGFALLPDAPPNRGLLDQVAALTWVRDNIAAFGGDPGNVTIFGESAGAMSVMTLLGMPRASGLFARAIAQSGAAQAGADPADARLVTGELSTVLGFDATAASLAGLPLEKLIAAQAAVRDAMAAAPDPARWGASVASSSMAFVPVVDGDVLPLHPLAALAAGHGADVPLLAGTNTEEFRLFTVPNGLAAAVTADVLPAVLGMLGIPPDIAELYQANRPAASPGDVMAALITDRFFRNPLFAAAEARSAHGPARSYLYEFGWRSQIQDLGAAHAVEIPFVFDNLSSPDAQLAIGDNPPTDLAAEMHAAWIRFATCGDPGWQPFDASYPVMTFGAAPGPGTVVLDPRGDERRSWGTG
jgi:para-nitrobenzyl esterase